MTKLSLANLAALSETASVPTYSRDQLTPGILHFGVGNFHRAHRRSICTNCSIRAKTSILPSSVQAFCHRTKR